MMGGATVVFRIETARRGRRIFGIEFVTRMLVVSSLGLKLKGLWKDSKR